MNLRLVELSFHRIMFEADFGDGVRRDVLVTVGTGNTWRQAVRFPTIQSELGESLGSDELDQRVRERAAEELCRLEAAAAIAREVA